MSNRKPPTIITQLSKDIAKVLEKHLINEILDGERFTSELKLLLSRYCYEKNLLYRDSLENRDYRLNALEDEADWFLNYVLLNRRIGLARVNSKLDKKGGKAENEDVKPIPTNMHKLFEKLCCFSQHRNRGEWKETKIERSKKSSSLDIYPDYFNILGKALRNQKKVLGDDISTVSRNTRTKFGSYWLIVGSGSETCSAEIGEELNLLEVLTMLPLPLKAGFSNNRDVLGILEKVIITLYNRYGLLRICGLPPQDWFPREKPSINGLRELTLLRIKTTRTEEWIQSKYDKAWETAFNLVIKMTKSGKIAGFKHFSQTSWKIKGYETFSYSEIGREMMDKIYTIGYIDGVTNPTVDAYNEYGEEIESIFDTIIDSNVEDHLNNKNVTSTDDHEESEDVEPPNVAIDPHPIIVSLHLDDEDKKKVLKKIINEASTELKNNPVLLEFITVIIEESEFFGKNGLFNDAHFRSLTEKDTRYNSLSDEELVKRLEIDIDMLIFEKQLSRYEKNNDMDASKQLVVEFIRHCNIGKNIFDKAFFKILHTRLPTNSPLKNLSHEELGRSLYRKAIDFINELDDY